jgi:AraC-like DNA-binding protein
LAKIAVDLERAVARRKEQGTPGKATPLVIARGDGWTVADVMCTSGPDDAIFEEQHSHYTIAMVIAGSFQYRSALGDAVMAPGGLMLGNHGQCFECRHEHGEGDRCVSFWYTPELFEQLADDAGRRELNFTTCRVTAGPTLSPLLAAAAWGATRGADVGWEEIAIALAVPTSQLASGAAAPASPATAEARVTRIVRAIDAQPDADLSLPTLAKHAGLSRYHFLRTFERVLGVTPHQYVLRSRLRAAAWRLVSGRDSVLDVALDCGFGDVSNFNRAFRREFGVSPQQYRRA